MENYIDIKDIKNIISEYCEKNNISLSKYAQLAGISKAWLSRLFHEDKKISLYLAERLLSVAGYQLKIVKDEIKISNSRLRRVI